MQLAKPNTVYQCHPSSHYWGMGMAINITCMVSHMIISLTGLILNQQGLPAYLEDQKSINLWRRSAFKKREHRQKAFSSSSGK